MASDPGLLYYCYNCERTVHLASPDTLMCADCHGDFIEESPDASLAVEDTPSSPDFTFNEIDNMGPGFGQLLEDMSSFLTYVQGARGLDPTNEEATHILGLGTDGRSLHPILLHQGRLRNLLNLRGDYGDDDEDYFVVPVLAENDPDKYGTPPASKSAIDALPSISICEEQLGLDGAQCAVCKDEFQLGSQVKQLPCNHIYHPDCIVPWLERHNSCPVCRCELPTDDPDYERSRAQGLRGGEYLGTTSADGSRDEERAPDSFSFQHLSGQPVVARYPTETDNTSEHQDVLVGVQAAGMIEGGINMGSNGDAAIGRRFSLLSPRLWGVPTTQSQAISQVENFSDGSNIIVLSEAGNDRNTLRERIIREMLASADNDGDIHMSETRDEELD